jgi:hypothetical protein
MPDVVCKLSAALNANAFSVEHRKPEKPQYLTCSTTSRCSITRDANTLGLACCRQRPLKVGKNRSCKASKRLAAIQCFRGRSRGELSISRKPIPKFALISLHHFNNTHVAHSLASLLKRRLGSRKKAYHQRKGFL